MINGIDIPAGLRSACKLSNTSGPGMGTADVAIYGMSLSQMNSLSTFGTQINQYGKNSATIRAGDASQMSLVLQGTVLQALSTHRHAGSMLPFCGNGRRRGSSDAIDPTSVKGSADVAKFAEQLAQRVGRQFEGNNAQIKLSIPYLNGSWRTQMSTLAEHAGLG